MKWILFGILIEVFSIVLKFVSSGMQNSVFMVAVIGLAVGTIGMFSASKPPSPPDRPQGTGRADRQD